MRSGDWGLSYGLSLKMHELATNNSFFHYTQLEVDNLGCLMLVLLACKIWTLCHIVIDAKIVNICVTYTCQPRSIQYLNMLNMLMLGNSMSLWLIPTTLISLKHNYIDKKCELRGHPCLAPTLLVNALG